MSRDPHETVQLASFVRSHADDVIAIWADRARELPPARELEYDALVDHLPPLLDRLADIIAGGAGGRHVPEPRDLAEKHASTRIEQGFKIAEIVREYALVRESVLLVIERHWAPRPSLQLLRVLDAALDAAVAGSVAAYSVTRDRWMQSLDRIGAAALESRSLDDLLRRLLEVFVQSVPAVSTAAIFLLDHQELRLRAAVGLEADVRESVSIPLGEGFAGSVGASRVPRLLQDAAHDPLVHGPILHERGVQALYGVPLIEEGQLLGVARMGSLTKSEFTTYDQRLFLAMTARASGAIYRTMLREAAEQRARQQHAVADFGLRALQTTNVAVIFDDAVVTTAETLGTEMVEVLELDPHGRMLLVTSGIGFRPGIVGATRVAATPGSQAGYALSCDTPVIVDDLRRETRFRGATVLLDHGIVSGMTVVIRAPGHGGRPFGVLGAHSRQHRTFTDDDIAFLQSVANVVAAAVVRAQDERRARQAEERCRLIVEQVRDYSILHLDPQGRVRSWTAGAERMTGWDEREVLGRHLASFFPADDVRAGRAERFLARARLEGAAEDEGWRVRKDGTCFWGIVTLTRLTDEDGELRGFAAVARDLTDRRRAESRHHFLADASRRLAESLDVDATLRSVAQLCIERLSDWCAIDLLDECGTLRRVTLEHRDPSRTHLAQRLEERYPTSPESSVAQRVVRTGESVLINEITEELLRESATDEGHLSLLRELGLVSYVCVPIRAAGRVLGTLALGSDDPRRLHDYFDLEIAEELAQRAAFALENARLYRSAQDAIGRREEVLAVVSHDLRNPLNVVQMGATLLVEGGASSLGSIEAQAKRILRAAQRMNRLIQDLLDLASLEKGRLTLIRREEDPVSIAREALETARGPACEHRLEVDLDVVGAPPAIHVDRDRILQVLANLCSNAVRIMPPGGKLYLGVEAREDDVVFWVRDTGPGIAPDEQSHLFERYWRGRETGYRGTGRGLAIAKGLVDAHGGRIWVESQPGRGATFFVALPHAPARR